MARPFSDDIWVEKELRFNLFHRNEKPDSILLATDITFRRNEKRILLTEWHCPNGTIAACNWRDNLHHFYVKSRFKNKL